jgi:HTH-type transcriptional regulator / antitoxin HigA
MKSALAEKYTLSAPSPTVISSERQHRQYLDVLKALMDRDDLTPDEEKYAQVIATLIEAFEEEHYPIPDASPVEVLRALIDANNLRQKDLAPIFGGEGIVSEVLNGKRELNRRHIERLAERFHVSPAVFF